MENIDSLYNEVAELGSDMTELILCWSKRKGHNPNFIMKLVGKGIMDFGQMGDFSRFKPQYGNVIRSYNNEELADYISELINQYDEMPAEDILEALNKGVTISG